MIAQRRRALARLKHMKSAASPQPRQGNANAGTPRQKILPDVNWSNVSALIWQTVWSADYTFLHIPKCAGSTISSWDRFSASTACPALRAQTAPPWLQLSMTLVAAHVPRRRQHAEAARRRIEGGRARLPQPLPRHKYPEVPVFVVAHRVIETSAQGRRPQPERRVLSASSPQATMCGVAAPTCRCALAQAAHGAEDARRVRLP